MNIEHWRKFIDSLEGEKGLPEDYRLLTPGVDTYRFGDEWLHGDFTWCAVSSASIGKLVDKNFNPVVRRVESRQIPDLKEKVKEFGRDIIYAAENPPVETRGGSYGPSEVDQFRALCEPEKDSKEVKQ